MTRPPFFKVDYGAGMRISAANRARNKEAYEEFEANAAKISASLRTWEMALHRNRQFLEAFEEVR